MKDNFQIFQLMLAMRIILAGVCGTIIGIERSNRSKSAGVRTHCIVAVGAALMMIISKYGFSDTSAGEFGMRGADGARIAAQVVSGIGFLGAGMIFVHKNSITGLTTAAGIWATSGIGMAIGAGMYVLGILTMFIVVAAQILFHRNFRWLKTPALKTVLIDEVDVPDYQNVIINKFRDMGISVVDVAAEKDIATGTRNYSLTIEEPDTVTEDEILNAVKYSCRIKNSL
ncbi:MAG: MgtC/SapB family protein [Firmicutes bacterium]|nr:MgtC/SapB family protein [Bacillota bacterium]